MKKVHNETLKKKRKRNKKDGKFLFFVLLDYRMRSVVGTDLDGSSVFVDGMRLRGKTIIDIRHIMKSKKKVNCEARTHTDTQKMYWSFIIFCADKKER